MQSNHIAVLVRDLAKTTEKLPTFCHLHEAERFESEGTLERYVDICEGGVPLLLIQAISAGPYALALQKRGSGLHHMGCVTPDLDQEIASCQDKGLLLHPTSLKTYPNGLVWLCRPALPFLIELAKGPEPEPWMTCQIALPAALTIPAYANTLMVNTRFVNGEPGEIGISMQGRKLTISLD